MFYFLKARQRKGHFINAVLFLFCRDTRATVFELHLKRNLSQRISKCRGNCGRKITDDDVLLVRSCGTTQFVKGGAEAEGDQVVHSRYGAIYIHFENECLKAFDSETIYGPTDQFDYSKITVPKETAATLNKDEKVLLNILEVPL